MIKNYPLYETTFFENFRVMVENVARKYPERYGLSYREISDAIGVELGTVKSRLNRGRANLKILLENGNFL